MSSGGKFRGAAAASAPDPDLERRFFRETGQAGEIAALVEPVIEDLGFRLVRVKMSGRDGGTVQIMVDNPHGQITVDDCASISRELSPLLDAADPIAGAWHLEISTPGIDRPLVRPRDFLDWAGYEARLTLREPVEGRKRFRGLLEGFEDGEVRLRAELEGWEGPQVLGFALSQIDQAKLIMTDKLIRAALAAR